MYAAFMYNKSPRGRLVDPAFTPLGGIVSRLLQRSLQAGLRLPGGLKPTPTFFTEDLSFGRAKRRHYWVHQRRGYRVL